MPRISSRISSAPSSRRSGRTSDWPSSKAMPRSRSWRPRRLTARCSSTRSSAATSGFAGAAVDVRQATACECTACVRIPDLDLKFVVHHGEAIFQKVAGRQELLGSDVIVVHRLLKNDVVEKQGTNAYALISQRTIDASDIDPAALGMVEHVETYDRIGDVRGWVHDLERRWQEEEARGRALRHSGRSHPRPGSADEGAAAGWHGSSSRSPGSG